jgi:hypothetical protein
MRNFRLADDLDDELISPTIGLAKWDKFCPMPDPREFAALLERGGKMDDFALVEFKAMMTKPVDAVKNEIGDDFYSTYEIRTETGQVLKYYCIRESDQIDFERDVDFALPFLQNRYRQTKPLVVTKLELTRLGNEKGDIV